jgi:uncharacterized protein YxeA
MIENKQLEIVKIILIFLILLVVVGGLAFYVFNHAGRSDYVHYSKCYKPLSAFSVESGTSANSILNQCGQNKTSKCTARANNLDEAIQYCEQNVQICDIFSFNSTTKTASIHPTNTKFNSVPGTGNDIFYRNAGVTYQNLGGGSSSITPQKLSDAVGTGSNLSLTPFLSSLGSGSGGTQTTSTN